MPRMRCEMEAGSRTGGRESGSLRGSSPIFRTDGTRPVRDSKSYEYIKDTSMQEKIAEVVCEVYPTYGAEADAVIELFRVNKWLKKGVLKLYKSHVNL